MSDSLVDMRWLGKAATALIEKVADAGWIIYEPTHVRRMAKAESDKALTIAEGQLRLTEFERRGLLRLAASEGRNQENVETIVANAIPQLTTDANVEELDPDWVSNFFDKCKTVSNVEMRKIWSTLLAGEANSHGSFSRKTIECTATLEKSDAEDFAKLCSFVGIAGGPLPLIYDFSEEPFTSHGIRLSHLRELENLGLVNIDFHGVHMVRMPENAISIRIGSKAYCVFGPPDKPFEFIHGRVRFTRVGEELFRIQQPTEIDGLIEHLFKHWKEFGYKFLNVSDGDSQVTGPTKIEQFNGWGEFQTWADANDITIKFRPPDESGVN